MIIPLDSALPKLHLESVPSSGSHNSGQTQTGEGPKKRHEDGQRAAGPAL